MTETKNLQNRKAFNKMFETSPNLKQQRMQKYSTVKNTINKSDASVTKGSRTNFRKENMKQLALKIKRYGELEQHESKIRNTLCIQPNYNASFGFELLNPIHGTVDANRLHNALRSNFKIPLVEKSIMNDIIERLAYVNENEILLSDMVFFEPSRNDPSYATYRRNFNQEQDENDTTWHRLFQEMWKALINTVKQRRIIQNEMNDMYPDAIDYMFEQRGIHKNDKFTQDDIENFMEEQLKSSIESELLRCILQTLDRDQDGKVSYQEFCDALYGAE